MSTYYHFNSSKGELFSWCETERTRHYSFFILNQTLIWKEQWYHMINFGCLFLLRLET